MRKQRDAVLVREWQAKARNDLHALTLLLRHRDAPADVVCFHAQQAVEKAIKTVLVANGLEPERTHDLVRLLESVEPFVPALASEEDALADLSEHAVRSRYPGHPRPPTLRQAVAAAVTARRIFAAVVAYVVKTGGKSSRRTGK